MTVLPARGERLSTSERFLLFLFFTVVIGFAGVVVNRGAFLQQRKTDLGVFLRAAWAVRSGADPYTITDDKGLLYHYPPLLAILLVPLADAPGSDSRMAFACKVGLWYALSLVFLALAVHGLARALERTAPELAARTRPAGSRHWWALRVLPVLACLPALGHGLSLGQVNVLWLALLCGMAAATLRRRPWRAGAWLAGAICLKVLPVFLLLFPLWRRDLRCLAGCALGLLAGLVVIPAAAMGPDRTLACYREWCQEVIFPAFGMGTHQARGQQLHAMTATHNQSLMAIFHNTLYPDPVTRPPSASIGVNRAHYLVGGLLTGIALLAAGWRRAESDTAPGLLLGALVLNMLLLSPAGHSHYLVLLLPLFMAMLATIWQQRGPWQMGALVMTLMVVNAVAQALPLLPGLGRLHDVGIAMYAGLLVWLTGLVLLWKQRQLSTVSSSGRPAASARAA
jgi:alpha-1,2-mannosyltransferase